MTKIIESEMQEIKTVKLEDLNYFWTSNGLPCFYADRPDIEQIVEGLGFSIYYLICNIAEDKPLNNNVSVAGAVAKPMYTTDLTTGVVKVVNNIVGRSVSAVTEDITELTSVRENGVYNMPAIPKVIVDKLDEFFRLVDAQHGTESIVLLTFDPSKNDSSGWGVLVPEQTNTSVHCNYNPDSIVEEKPENVLIVGSVHSHPGMAAYASGTDHADQADFDGLHITYGWQKTLNNGATQYHIEMQMAGTSWTLKPEDVFESFDIKKEPDPDVVEWSEKVKKVYPPLHQQAGVSSIQQYQASPTLTTTTVPGTNKYRKPEIKTEGSHILVAEIDPAFSGQPVICPSCGYRTGELDLQRGYCHQCDVPLVSAGDLLDDILTQVKFYLNCRYVEDDTTVYLWTIDPITKEEIVMNIGIIKFINDVDVNFSYSEVQKTANQVPAASGTMSATWDYQDDLDDKGFESFDPDLTLCCGVDIVKGECTCKVPVLYEDVMDFENYHEQTDVYEWTSKCLECRFYSGPGCKSYVDAVVDYATNRTKLSVPIRECNSFELYVNTYESSTEYKGYL